MLLTNCHTHTVFCDGKATPQAMAAAAYEQGFVSLGFSGHSPMNFENDYAMTVDAAEAYRSHIQALKSEYAGKMQIYCGLELDKDSAGVDLDLSRYDYLIASVHQIRAGGRIYSVDYTPAELARCCNEQFGSSWLRLCEHYFQSLCDHVVESGAQVVGHFDLVTKFNQTARLFDESEREYQGLAIKYAALLLEKRPDVIFEVNTGAMFRLKNKTPYPSRFITEFLIKNGARLTVTSDAHCTEALGYELESTAQGLKRMGLRSIWALLDGGFKELEL